MEIRIRIADESESRLLAEIPFRRDAIDSIIPTLGAWGVIGSDGETYAESDLSGQFVDNGTSAYFEILLSE